MSVVADKMSGKAAAKSAEVKKGLLQNGKPQMKRINPPAEIAKPSADCGR